MFLLIHVRGDDIKVLFQNLNINYITFMSFAAIKLTEKNFRCQLRNVR